VTDLGAIPSPNEVTGAGLAVEQGVSAYGSVLLETGGWENTGTFAVLPPGVFLLAASFDFAYDDLTLANKDQARMEGRITANGIPLGTTKAFMPSAMLHAQSYAALWVGTLLDEAVVVPQARAISEASGGALPSGASVYTSYLLWWEWA
jgi:hypothetical protein